MLTIFARNVASALPQGLRLLREVGVEENSRAGRVLVAPCPVMTVYDNPCERVLFSAKRDANPFFHLAEAMWMLSGRNDTGFLDLFVRDFGKRFAESNGTVHGAYGFRWREHFGVDQLDKAVSLLKLEPTSRQVILTMWDPQFDLGTIVRDRPCNTQIYLRITKGVLDITVTSRSNDMIWGTYGANAVHFSILQEYLATRLGVAVGRYYQLSNNFHAYVEQLRRYDGQDLDDQRSEFKPMRLVDDPETFDNEVATVLELPEIPGRNLFLSQTVRPMLQAHRAWRLKQNPMVWLERIAAPDWRVAATEWMNRRKRP